MTRTQRTYRLAADVAAALACTFGAIVTLGDIHTPLRSGVVAAALVAGTGWAATCWADLTEAAFAGTAALAAGLSSLFFYGLFFVEIGWWHPVGSIGALLVAAAALNAASVLRDVHRKAEP
jgi:hypothetical protein